MPLLTKREYFAAIAIQGAIKLPWAQSNPDQAAVTAVRFADELIKALAKPLPDARKHMASPAKPGAEQ